MFSLTSTKWLTCHLKPYHLAKSYPMGNSQVKRQSVLTSPSSQVQHGVCTHLRCFHAIMFCSLMSTYVHVYVYHSSVQPPHVCILYNAVQHYTASVYALRTGGLVVMLHCIPSVHGDLFLFATTGWDHHWRRSWHWFSNTSYTFISPTGEELLCFICVCAWAVGVRVSTRECLPSPSRCVSTHTWLALCCQWQDH